MTRLRRGDLLPRIVSTPPGPRSRQLARRVARYESPGVNTLGPDGTTLVWQEARGSNVTDVDGNRYLDLTAGFGVAAVVEAAEGNSFEVPNLGERSFREMAVVITGPPTVFTIDNIGDFDF